MLSVRNTSNKACVIFLFKDYKAYSDSSNSYLKCSFLLRLKDVSFKNYADIFFIV